MSDGESRLVFSTSSQCLSPCALTLMTRGQVLSTCGPVLTIQLGSGVPHMVTSTTQEGVLSPRSLILMIRLRKRTRCRLTGRTLRLQGTNRGEDSSECELSGNPGRISILIDFPYLGKLVRKIILTRARPCLILARALPHWRQARQNPGALL